MSVSPFHSHSTPTSGSVPVVLLIEFSLVSDFTRDDGRILAGRVTFLVLLRIKGLVSLGVIFSLRGASVVSVIGAFP